MQNSRECIYKIDLHISALIIQMQLSNRRNMGLRGEAVCLTAY
jgi:hypothetical protein